MRRILMASLVGWLALASIGQAQRGGKPGCQGMAGGGQTQMMSRMMGGGSAQSQMVSMTGGSFLQAQMFPKFPMASGSSQARMLTAMTPTGGQTPANCGRFSQSQMMTKGPKTGGGTFTQAQIFPTLQTTGGGSVRQSLMIPGLQTTGGGSSFTQSVLAPRTGTGGSSQMQTARPCSKTIAMNTPQIMVPRTGFPGLTATTQQTTTQSSNTIAMSTPQFMVPRTGLPALTSTNQTQKMPKTNRSTPLQMANLTSSLTNAGTPTNRPMTHRSYCVPSRTNLASLIQNQPTANSSLLTPTSSTPTPGNFTQSQLVPQLQTMMIPTTQPQTMTRSTTQTLNRFALSQVVPLRTATGTSLSQTNMTRNNGRTGGNSNTSSTVTMSNRQQRPVCPSAGGSFVSSSYFPTTSLTSSPGLVDTAMSAMCMNQQMPQQCMQNMIDQSLQLQANIDQMSQVVAANTVATLNNMAQTQRHMYVLMMLENYQYLARSQRPAIPIAIPASTSEEDAEVQTSPTTTQSAAIDLGFRSLALPAW